MHNNLIIVSTLKLLHKNEIGANIAEFQLWPKQDMPI